MKQKQNNKMVAGKRSDISSSTEPNKKVDHKESTKLTEPANRKKYWINYEIGDLGFCEVAEEDDGVGVAVVARGRA